MVSGLEWRDEGNPLPSGCWHIFAECPSLNVVSEGLAPQSSLRRNSSRPIHAAAVVCDTSVSDGDCAANGRAIVIIGGLVTSTLLNLFVVPSLYLQFAKSPAERDLVAAEV